MSSTLERRRELIPTTVPEAKAKNVGLPQVALQEATVAMDRLKEVLGDRPAREVFEIIDPISRVIGWAEALVYATETFPNLITNTNTSTLPLYQSSAGMGE